MRVLGIDPGVHGGLAIVAINNDVAPQLVDAIDVPTVGVGAKERVNALLLRDWINRHAPAHALIERSGAMPGQGIASTFKYARAVGALEAVTTCLAKIRKPPDSAHSNSSRAPTICSPARRSSARRGNAARDHAGAGRDPAEGRADHDN